MIALCDRPVPALASSERSWGSESPPAAIPPIFINPRRDSPSQWLLFLSKFPRKSSMLGMKI